MAWRGPKTAASADPLLRTATWRTIRTHWQKLRLPCARCHLPIDYDGPQYLTTRTGRRKQNPRYLTIGHIVGRYEARRRGWTEAQINALTNTQPECVDCSNRSGAKLGQRVQAKRMAVRRVILDESRRW